MKTPVQPKLRLRDRRRRLLWVKVAAGTAVVLVSFVLIWFIARLPNVTISTITVSGATIADSEDIRRAVAYSLAGTYLYLVPKSNGLVVSTGSIKKMLLATFPPMSDVQISRVGLQGLNVVVSEREAVAYWCDSDCYLMDATGYIFSKAHDSGRFTTYRGSFGEELTVGSTYLSGQFPSLFQLTRDMTKKIGHSASTVSVDPSRDVELAFTDGGVVKFVMGNSTDDTLDNIASVFASQRFKNGEKFEYADFRFGDKVYVKFIGE